MALRHFGLVASPDLGLMFGMLWRLRTIRVNTIACASDREQDKSVCGGRVPGPVTPTSPGGVTAPITASKSDIGGRAPGPGPPQPGTLGLEKVHDKCS